MLCVPPISANKSRRHRPHSPQSKRPIIAVSRHAMTCMKYHALVNGRGREITLAIDVLSVV